MISQTLKSPPRTAGQSPPLTTTACWSFSGDGEPGLPGLGRGESHQTQGAASPGLLSAGVPARPLPCFQGQRGL